MSSITRFGLSAFLTLAACGLAPQASAQEGGQTLRRLAEGFVSPLTLVSLSPQRLLVGDQAGVISVLDTNGNRIGAPFLDLRDRMVRLNQGFDERGLLGVALHPGFDANRRLFVYYSAPRRASCPTNWDHTSRISEFTVSPDLSRADASSERVLMEIDQPYYNHNGGRLVFGPDGYLYAGLGDGGNANDQGHDRAPTGNGQDLTTLLGKILRIDVDQSVPGRGYAIPADNPLLDVTGARPEIFAWGLRNPWGISFDRGGERSLFAADVGQGRYEEINIIRRGANYGWNQREGRHAFDPRNPSEPGAERSMQAADRSAWVDPIVEYKNVNAFPGDPEALGISVTGGYVYRGKALPHLQGRYVFADWSRQWAVPDGRLFMATPDGPRWRIAPLPVASHPGGRIGGYIVGLGEDHEGELYVLMAQKAGPLDRTGSVWKLVSTGRPGS